MKNNPTPHRVHRNISLFQLLPYVARFPASAWVSLLHRVSGALIFVLLPLIICTFDMSLASEVSFSKLQSLFGMGVGWVPGWLFKLLTLAVVWAFLHHLVAGLRFLILDVNHHAADKQRSKRSAQWVFFISVPLTIVIAAKIFSAY